MYVCMLMVDSKITVKVVEDTDDIRNALRVLIDGSPGFKCVHVYADAEEALQDMPSEAVELLTARENEILDFLARGFLYK